MSECVYPPAAYTHILHCLSFLLQLLQIWISLKKNEQEKEIKWRCLLASCRILHELFFFFFRGHAFCMEKSWAELAGWISLASAISPGFLDDFLAQRLICFGSSSGEQSAWGSPIWTTPMSRWQFESGPWTGEVRLWFQYVCTFIHMNKHTSYIYFI